VDIPSLVQEVFTNHRLSDHASGATEQASEGTYLRSGSPGCPPAPPPGAALTTAQSRGSQLVPEGLFDGSDGACPLRDRILRDSCYSDPVSPDFPGRAFSYVEVLVRQAPVALRAPSASPRAEPSFASTLFSISLISLDMGSAPNTCPKKWGPPHLFVSSSISCFRVPVSPTRIGSS